MYKVKVLPMGIPEITSYSSYSNILSIVSTFPNNETWILNRFLQIYIDKSEYNRNEHFLGKVMFDETLFFVEKTIPFIDSTKISREFIDLKWKCFGEFVIDCINLDYYIFFVGDEFFIPDSAHFQKRYFPHPVFIFGYDQDSDKIYNAGSLRDGKYLQGQTSTHLIESCFRSSAKDDYFKGVYLHKKVSASNITKEELAFDLDLVLKGILNFLEPEVTNDNSVKGVNVYQVIIDYLIILRDKNNEVVDLRPFHVIWEHKKLMAMRIDLMISAGYLSEIDNFDNDFKNIANKFLTIRNLMLKYNITKNNMLLNNVITNLSELITFEKECLKRVLLYCR